MECEEYLEIKVAIVLFLIFKMNRLGYSILGVWFDLVPLGENLQELFA